MSLCLMTWINQLNILCCVSAVENMTFVSFGVLHVWFGVFLLRLLPFPLKSIWVFLVDFSQFSESAFVLMDLIEEAKCVNAVFACKQGTKSLHWKNVDRFGLSNLKSLETIKATGNCRHSTSQKDSLMFLKMNSLNVQYPDFFTFSP